MRDTGIGMSPEVIEHAFEPFFTTKEIGRGTGLGLSMVFGVARQFDGVVRIDSRIRKFTCRERLRRQHRDWDGRRRSNQPEKRTFSSWTTIPTSVWVTAECLRGSGHHVSEARSGGTALAMLDRGDLCDLLVMDLAMRGLSGAETVRLARRTRPNLKALFCTGYAESRGSKVKPAATCCSERPLRPTL
jgi:hypothetical protein